MATVLTAPMKLESPFEGDLAFHSMTATEEISRLFELNIIATSANPELDPKKILGQMVVVKVELLDGTWREFSGHVTEFGLVADESSNLGYQYAIVARPWLWLLTRASDCKIFQAKSAPDIIKAVFALCGVAVFSTDLVASYPALEYVVQYRETDFNFVSRLMEHNGIHYFFEHKGGQHKMVLTDGSGAHKPAPGAAKIKYTSSHGVGIDAEALDQWLFNRSLQSQSFTLRDYDFKRPADNLETTKAATEKVSTEVGKHFDYPGEYFVSGDGQALVSLRIEELRAQQHLITGGGNVRGATVGALFKLDGHPRPDQNGKDFLVVSTRIRMQNGKPGQRGGGSGVEFHVSLTAMPAATPYRPRRLTPKPFVQGIQTATVVGPAGEEIHTDTHGRIRVHFHWDRVGTHADNDSCWMRVAYPWAGPARGWVSIPRIGDEVVVDFLEGDPDRPLVTGSVYNGQQPPPWALPANKTQTGILTRSSLKGGANANANVFRFEDKKGAEQVFLHAEKNQDIEVENDETHWVGHDRTKTIDHDETTHVKHDRTETVDHNETITIGVDRTENVGSNESITIGKNRTEDVGDNESITIGKDRDETVGKNETISIGKDRDETVGDNETVSIGKNREHQIGKDAKLTVGENRTTQIGKDDKLQVGKKLHIDAGDEITIVTGDASISMKKDGTIQIKGKDITIIGSGKIAAKASGDMVLKGSKIAEN
jgi:type VI secretion system secreted protein VgrG